MKRLVLFLAVVPAIAAAAPQQRFPAPEGMQTVHIAMLYRGPAYSPGSTPELQKLQEAHLAHLTKLGKEDHAYIAGPIGGDGDLRGIVMLKAPTAEAARALEADDPAVKAGRLRIEMVSFTAPANWFTFGPIRDDLSMRQFVFGFLNSGPNEVTTPERLAELQQDHLANLWALRETGALVLAGPTVGSQVHAGVVVMTSDSVEKATALLEQDPMVKARFMTIELYPWFAADGIMKGK